MASEDEYQKRIESLEYEVERLRELVFTLCMSVEYRADKPFDALLSQLMIYGQKRIELFLILHGLSTRIAGNKHVTKPKTLLRENEQIKEAYSDEPISENEAIALLAEVVGVDAQNILHAFMQQYRSEPPND